MAGGVWIQAVVHMQQKIPLNPAVGPIFLVAQHQWSLKLEQKDQLHLSDVISES